MLPRRGGANALPPPPEMSSSDEDLPPPGGSDDDDDLAPPPASTPDEEEDGLPPPEEEEGDGDGLPPPDGADGDVDFDDASLLPPPIDEFVAPSAWGAGSSARAKIKMVGTLGALQRRSSKLAQARITRARKHSYVSDQFRLRREMAAMAAKLSSKPSDATPHSDWEQLVDERSQRAYYRSVVNGQQLWSWPSTAYATNVWYAELRSLVAVSTVGTLQTAMRGWADADKAVCVLRELPSATERAQVMASLNAPLLRAVFRHAQVHIESRIGCCRLLLQRASEAADGAAASTEGDGGDGGDDGDDGATIVARLIASCGAGAMIEMLGTLYEEEGLLDDGDVAALLEGAEASVVAEVMVSYAAEDAHSIARHWSDAFAKSVLAAARGAEAEAWRLELRALLDESDDDDDDDDDDESDDESAEESDEE